MVIWDYLPKTRKKKEELTRRTCDFFRDIWDSLPRTRRKRKELARIRIHEEMVKTLYDQRDLAINEAGEKGRKVEELESQVQKLNEEIYSHEEVVKKIEGERDHYKNAIRPVIKAAGKVKRAREDCLADILLGSQSKFESDHRDPPWIYEAVIRVAKGLRDERNLYKKQIEELKKDHLSEIVKILGGYERIDRVPLAVYSGGEFIYETRMFEKMIRSTYSLDEALKKNGKFTKALNKRKRVSVEYEEGKLFFIPESLKNHRSVAIAYYVPEGNRRIRKIFGRQGEKATKAIYKTLKSLEKRGLNFVNDGNQ